MEQELWKWCPNWRKGAERASDFRESNHYGSSMYLVQEGPLWTMPLRDKLLYLWPTRSLYKGLPITRKQGSDACSSRKRAAKYANLWHQWERRRCWTVHLSIRSCKITRNLEDRFSIRQSPIEGEYRRYVTDWRNQLLRIVGDVIATCRVYLLQ